MPDLNTTEMDSAVKMLAGTARSMGIEVGQVEEAQKPEEPPIVNRQGWEGETSRFVNYAKTRKALQRRQVQADCWRQASPDRCHSRS